MRKIYSLLLMATLLLVSGNMWGATKNTYTVPSAQCPTLSSALEMDYNAAKSTTTTINLDGDVTEDVEAISEGTCTGEITINLNNHKLTGNIAGNSKRAIKIYGGTYNGVISSGISANAVYLGTSATKTVSGTMSVVNTLGKVFIYPASSDVNITIGENVVASINNGGDMSTYVTNNGTINLPSYDTDVTLPTGHVQVASAGTYKKKITIPSGCTFEIFYGSFKENVDFEVQEGASFLIKGGKFYTKDEAYLRNYVPSGYQISFKTTYYEVEKNPDLAKVSAEVAGSTSYYENVPFATLASGTTYKLLEDLSYSTPQSMFSGLSAGKSAIIDLDGHTLTIDGSSTGAGALRFANASSNCSVTFKNGTLVVNNLAGGSNPSIDVTGTGNKLIFAAGLDVKINREIVIAKGGQLETEANITVTGNRFAIAGNGSEGNGGTTITIKGGTITSPTTAIYHPQEGTLNISGGEISGALSCIEFRGGEANISGGHFYCSKAYADNDAHSGGTSTEGCGFGINPYQNVTVNITGGTFEAYCPFYQAQATGADKTITTTISGGKFKAINGSKKTIWAETTNKFITGGYYNLSPAAYVAENKAVVPNDDPVYKFAIADVEPAVTFTNPGQWSAAGNWIGVATSATPVVIDANCVITNGVVANVYGLTLNSGNTLTVKKGAKLIIGAEGLVNNAAAANLIIEDGAYVAINPVATNTQFAATVHHASQTRALTESEKSTSAHGYTMLWEVCANPIGDATFTFPASATDVRASRWSNGWVGVNSLSEIATPFGAYMMATNAATKGEDMHWAGTTNGVANQSITATKEGWYFVGNSYLAPIDIVELIDNLGANVEKQIYMYKATTESFDPISRATAGTGNRFDTKNSVVEPKSGFFVRATGATTIGLDYTQTVWDALNAKVAAAAAPARHKVIVAPRQEIEHTAKMELAVQSLDDATRYSVLDIFEAAAYTTSKQDDYDYTAFINPTPNINFVAEQYGVQLNTVSLPSLDGLTLAFNTGASTNLRIYFDNVEGATYYLYDAVTKTYTPIVDGTWYDFSVATATGDVMVSDRFTIVAQVVDVTTNVNGWATYCDDADHTLPAGLKAYKGAYDEATSTLVLTEVDYIKANEGVVVRGTASTGYTLPLGNGSDDFSDNELKGNATDEAMNVETGADTYCMHTVAGVTEFAHYTGAQIPPHRAYYLLTSARNDAPARIAVRIVEHTDTTTGMENVEGSKIVKYVKNGNLFIEKNGHVYNAQGKMVK